MDDKIKVTIIATGFEDKAARKAAKKEKDEDKLNIGKKLDDFEKEILGEDEKETRTSKVSEEDFKSMDKEDYLDIPTFLRKEKE